VLKFPALPGSGMFAGAVFYLTSVEHPARMTLGASIALPEFRPATNAPRCNRRLWRSRLECG